MSLRMVAFQSWPLTYFCSMFAHVLLLIGLGRSSLLAAFLATVICFFWPSAVLFLHVSSFTFFFKDFAVFDVVEGVI